MKLRSENTLIDNSDELKSWPSPLPDLGIDGDQAVFNRLVFLAVYEAEPRQDAVLLVYFDLFFVFPYCFLEPAHGVADDGVLHAEGDAEVPRPVEAAAGYHQDSFGL